MKRYLLFAALIVSTYSLSVGQSSTKKNTIKGDKKIITKEFSISEYSKIKLSSLSDIVFEQRESDSPSLAVELDENLMQYIEVKVENDELRVDVKKGNNIKPSKFTVYTNSKNLEAVSLNGAGSFKALEKVKASDLKLNIAGAGSITFDKLETKSIECFLPGVGNINLSGSGDFAKYIVSGVGNIKAKNFVAKEVDCNVSGVGSSEVYATDKLKAHVSGVGNIKYRGNPSDLSKSSPGLGSVKSIGD